MSKFDINDPALQDALAVCGEQPIAPRCFNHSDPEETTKWLTEFYYTIESYPKVVLREDRTKRSKFYLDVVYFLGQGPDQHNDWHELPWLWALQFEVARREDVIYYAVKHDLSFQEATVIIQEEFGTNPHVQAIDQDTTGPVVDLRLLNHGLERYCTLDTSDKKEKGAKSNKGTEGKVIGIDSADENDENGEETEDQLMDIESADEGDENGEGSEEQVIGIESADEDDESEEASEFDDDEEPPEKSTKVKHRTTKTKSASDARKTYTQNSRSDAKNAKKEVIPYHLPRCTACIDRRKSCSRLDGSGVPCEGCAKSKKKTPCVSEKLQEGPNPFYGRDKSQQKKRSKKA